MKRNKKMIKNMKDNIIMTSCQKLKRDYQIENNLYWSLFVDTEEDLKRRQALKELSEKLIKIDNTVNY